MRNRGILLSITITTIFLLVYYLYQLSNANHLNYGQWGDGYKNFYTICYYLKFNSGAHFTGMNYPYGENVVFCDAQPMVVWILKPVSCIFPSITGYIHAYLALAIFISIIISAAFIYKILREFDVNEFQAVLFSSLIAMLSPQLIRLMGHYALGYSCFLPILLFWLVRYFKTNGSLRIAVYIALTLIFFSFIHVYYLGMGAMFILCILLVFALTRIRELRKHLRFMGRLLLSCVIPFIVLKGYLVITDPINDRPHSPWGFFNSSSSLSDIFLHRYSFTGEEAGILFPRAHFEYSFEGMGYIGLIATISLLAIIIITFVRYSKIKKLNNTYYLNVFLIAATLVLLFAMAFPFNIAGLEGYYDDMPAAVKQFRASGRFNWVFYYTATIYAAVLIHHWYRSLVNKNKRVWGVAIVIIACGMWFIEMNMISVRYAKDFRKVSDKIDDKRESADLMEQFKRIGRQPSEFQAILALPFFLNGSEKLYLDAPTGFFAMKASLFTGLPLIDTKLSRSSEAQTFKIVNLLSSDYIQKKVLKDFHNDKSLLLLASDNDFSAEEKKLISKATPLFTFGTDKYYELPLSAFADSTKEIKKYFSANRLKLFSHDGYLSDDSANNVIVKRFEDEPKNYAVFGHGARYADNKDIYFVAGILPGARDSTDYVASAWVYSDERRAAFPLIFITQVDSFGKEIGHYEANPKFSTNTYGKWVRAEIDFTLYNKNNKIYMMAKDRYASFDEAVIRPRSINVFTGVENDSTFMYNNYPIR